MPGQPLLVPDGALDEPTPADIAPRASKASMDKSDPPNEPLRDAPTVKTEPTRPASESAAERDQASQVSAEHVASPPEADPAGPQAQAPASDFVTSEPAPAAAPLHASERQEWRPLIERIDKQRAKTLIRRAGKVAVLLFCGWFIAIIVLVAVFRFVNPPFSTLMAMQWVSGTKIDQRWEPIDNISPNLVRAVITSEDGRFCRHWGIDYIEVVHAIRNSSGGIPRGASTISMQVAKNLFLWPSKSYVRKAIEVPVTYAIELFWPKRRIMEVYLNIAEWGPGVFGAEAAARSHFGRSASRLTRYQSARLAVSLPNPITRDAGNPGPWTRRRAGVIQRRAASSPQNAACVVGSG